MKGVKVLIRVLKMNGKAQEASQIEMDVEETEAILQQLNQAALEEVDR